jgi:hypothetical protein
MASLRVAALVNLAPANLRREILSLLDSRCSTGLPFCEKDRDELIERIQMAVIRKTAFDMRCISENVDLANTDWRDLLVLAEFADDLSAHQVWCDRCLSVGRLV